MSPIAIGIHCFKPNWIDKFFSCQSNRHENLRPSSSLFRWLWISSKHIIITTVGHFWCCERGTEWRDDIPHTCEFQRIDFFLPICYKTIFFCFRKPHATLEIRPTLLLVLIDTIVWYLFFISMDNCTERKLNKAIFLL